MNAPSTLSPILKRIGTDLRDLVDDSLTRVTSDQMAEAVRAEVVATFPEVPIPPSCPGLGLEYLGHHDLLAFAEACAEWRAQFNA